MNEALKRANEKRLRGRAKNVRLKKDAFKSPESELQKLIQQESEKRGVHIIHVTDQAWKFVLQLDKNDWRQKQFQEWFLQTFRHLPDCLVYRNGRSWSAEIKNRFGSVSGGQKKKIDCMGANVFVNLKETIESLEKWMKE